MLIFENLKSFKWIVSLDFLSAHRATVVFLNPFLKTRLVENMSAVELGDLFAIVGNEISHANNATFFSMFLLIIFCGAFFDILGNAWKILKLLLLSCITSFSKYNNETSPHKNKKCTTGKTE